MPTEDEANALEPVKVGIEMVGIMLDNTRERRKTSLDDHVWLAD